MMLVYRKHVARDRHRSYVVVYYMMCYRRMVEVGIRPAYQRFYANGNAKSDLARLRFFMVNQPLRGHLLNFLLKS